MDGILNENQLTVVTEYEFHRPEIHEVDYIFDTVIEDCKIEFFFKRLNNDVCMIKNLLILEVKKKLL